MCEWGLRTADQAIQKVGWYALERLSTLKNASLRAGPEAATASYRLFPPLPLETGEMHRRNGVSAYRREYRIRRTPQFAREPSGLTVAAIVIE